MLIKNHAGMHNVYDAMFRFSGFILFILLNKEEFISSLSKASIQSNGSIVSVDEAIKDTLTPRK